MNELVLSSNKNYEDSVSNEIFNKYGEDLTNLSEMSSDKEDDEDSVSNEIYNEYNKDLNNLSKSSSEKYSNDTTVVISNKRRD